MTINNKKFLVKTKDYEETITTQPKPPKNKKKKGKKRKDRIGGKLTDKTVKAKGEHEPSSQQSGYLYGPESLTLTPGHWFVYLALIIIIII